MNIVKEKTDNLNARLKIIISENDYEPRIVAELKKQRRKAQIKGFRPGKAPLNLIRKMVGNSVKMQEIDNIISETLSKYMVDEKSKILGQPLPSKEQKSIDIEHGKEYEFLFDIGIAPEFELKLNDSKVPYYNIRIEDDLIEKEKERYQNQFAKAERGNITKEKSYLKGNVKQIDEIGNIIENGISAEDTMLAIDIIKDNEIKEKFTGVNINESVNFDIKKAFPNDTEIAGILKIDKKEVPNIPTDFQFEIKEITTYTPAEINQELFDKAFKGGRIKNETEFKEKITEGIAVVYKNDSDYRFTVDAKNELINKTEISLPDNFLKRWLKTTDKEKKYTDEVLEKEYPAIAIEFKWQLIKEKISTEQKITVEEQDIRNEAQKFTESQFMQYGIPLQNIGEQELNNFIDKSLEKDEDKNRFAQTSLEKKVLHYIMNEVELDKKEITTEEFKELYQTEKK